MTQPTAPLHGHRVLVARTREQAGELSARVRELGGQPVEAPVLALEPGDRDALDAAARELVEGRFALLALTSANGVDALADAFARVSEPQDPRAGGSGDQGRSTTVDRPLAVQASVLERVGTVACVGTGTAARFEQRFGRGPDLVPPTATTRALGEAVPAGSGAALLPRADLASPELPRLLSDKGYDTVEVVAYRIGRPGALPPGVADDVRSGAIDLVPLTSPSMARNLVTLIGAPEIGGRVVSIGPVTSAACAAIGVEVAAEADPHDLDGLLAALTAVAGQEPPTG